MYKRQAFHNRRWDGDFLTVRKLIESGCLGELMLCELHWDRFRPAIRPGWRDNPAQGASLLNDLGPHLIDQALQLFGKPDALAADLAAGRDAAEAQRSAIRAARLGMRSTAAMVARRGLALRLGERSVGHRDPGAVSCFILLLALAER